MNIELNDQTLAAFKSYLLASYTQDIYYQMKSYLEEYDNYSEALEYFIENLTSDLQWGDV